MGNQSCCWGIYSVNICVNYKVRPGKLVSIDKNIVKNENQLVQDGLSTQVERISNNPFPLLLYYINTPLEALV